MSFRTVKKRSYAKKLSLNCVWVKFGISNVNKFETKTKQFTQTELVNCERAWEPRVETSSLGKKLTLNFVWHKQRKQIWDQTPNNLLKENWSIVKELQDNSIEEKIFGKVTLNCVWVKFVISNVNNIWNQKTNNLLKENWSILNELQDHEKKVFGRETTTQLCLSKVWYQQRKQHLRP